MDNTNIAFQINGLFLNVPFEGCLGYRSELHACSWRLIFKDNPSIAHFIQFMGGVNVMNILPPPFSTFTDFGVQSMDLVYDMETKQIGLIQAEIGTSPENHWQLLPNLQVSDLHLTCRVDHPREAGKQVSFHIGGNFYIGSSGNNRLSASATVPNFKAKLSLAEGTISTGDLFSLFWPDASLDLKSEVTCFDMEIDPTTQNYQLFCGVKSDWTFLSLSEPSLDFTMTGLSLAVFRRQGNTEGKITGLFHIGEKTGNGRKGLDISLSASYVRQSWCIEGGTGGQSISLTDIAHTFLKPFKMEKMPDWVNGGGMGLYISNLQFRAVMPVGGTENGKSYSVSGEVEWNLDFGGFKHTLDAAISISYAAGSVAGYPNGLSGKITGKVDILGLDFEIGYRFGDGESDLFLQWEGAVASYDSKNNRYCLDFGTMSLGDIITKLTASVIPGFKLPAPWNALDKVSLTNCRFILDKSKDEIALSYKMKLDLGFIDIDAIHLTKKSEGVLLGFEGKFLGLDISDAEDSPTKSIAGKGCDIQALPVVGGSGEMFDLRFLVAGQHVSPSDVSRLTSVDEAIQCLEEAFTDPDDNPGTIPVGTDSSMIFNPDSSWLIAADFTVARFYRLSVVFNDPDLYGLDIGVAEDAKFLQNLQFSILYKKISDTVGVYQTELQLPDCFRHLEFGAISVTLPNIGIRIYTNGDFYLDFGWPVSLTDFSRSFSMQIFPFTGSGGFYFASLSEATATDLPAVKQGTFAPVIKAGIALSLGIGKTINGGIFKAELYLTAIGMIEGTYAVFNPSPLSVYSGQTDVYYRFAGTLSLVGKISCEINFVIISASLEATTYLIANVIIEAYKAVPLYFEAGLSLKMTLKINLGLFKINLKLSFSTTISASFTLGSDNTQESLWYLTEQGVSHNTLNKRLALSAGQSACPVWKPIEIDEVEREELHLYFMPHLTVSGTPAEGEEGGHPQYPQYVGMLYLDNLDDKGITALATGCFYWALGAILGAGTEGSGISLEWLKEQKIQREEIECLLAYMDSDGGSSPFDYCDEAGQGVRDFIRNFFRIRISAPSFENSEEHPCSVFPIIPDLILTRKSVGTEEDTVDFMEGPVKVDRVYIETVHALLDALKASPETARVKSFYGNLRKTPLRRGGNAEIPQTLAAFVFADFIALVTKEVLQYGLEDMAKSKQHEIKVETLVSNVVKGKDGAGGKATEIAGMASRFLLHGLRLPTPSDKNPEDTLPLYVLTGQQWTIPLKREKEEQVHIITLSRKEEDREWLSIGDGESSLEIVIDGELSERNERMAAIHFEPSVTKGYPRAITNRIVIPQSFSLGMNIHWEYPGKLFSATDDSEVKENLYIWKLPEAFRTVLQENAGRNIGCDLLTLTKKEQSVEKGTIDNFKWGTLVPVKIRRQVVSPGGSVLSGIYELSGTNEADTHLLEALLKKLLDSDKGSNKPWSPEQLYLLMRNEAFPTKEKPVSYVNSTSEIAIIKTNMSTETNPEIDLLRNTVANSNMLNTLKDFITYLWECSVVRSGGFYMYHKDALPDYLFDENGNASIMLLVTYCDFVPETFSNVVITDSEPDFSETSVYVQSPEITMTVPAIPQGCVGYELLRDVPSQPDFASDSMLCSEKDDEIYLDNQFNLLGLRLPDFIEYQNYTPASPLDSDNESVWRYDAVIPYYKIRAGSGYDPEFPNPYVGIGEEVRMKLCWQDLFGNTFERPSMEVSMKLSYTDAIIGVSQWPSVSCSFYFKKGEKDDLPHLCLTFSFDTSRYRGLETGRSNALTDLSIYKKLYYQLQTGHLNMKVLSTIEGTKEHPEGFDKNVDTSYLLSRFVVPVITYLEGPNTRAPEDFCFEEAVTWERVANYCDTIPLDVRILMKRNSHVDSDFVSTPGIAENSTVVQPCQKFGVGEETLSLVDFADKFEEAFSSHGKIRIKIAVSSEMQSESKKLWMARFASEEDQTGIDCRYYPNKPQFFAPRPLSTSLQSFSASVTPYQTGVGLLLNNDITKNFSAVDMDVWGKQFLDAVDRFLSPETAVPVFLLDKGKLSDIIECKEQIADAIAGTVDRIILSGDLSEYCYQDAKEKWHQEILKELSSAYRYTAAVQIPVEIRSSWEAADTAADTVPKFYGRMSEHTTDIRDDMPKEYGLSTSKMPLHNGKSNLTYLFECKNSSDFRNFKFDDLHFEISHLEQDIKEVGIGKYTSSRWLTFVRPLEEKFKKIGHATIPVPLRAYPVAPSVVSQEVIYKGGNRLREALRWDFEFTYKNTLIAQDTIELQLVLNTPGEKQANALRISKPDLRQRLAQFMECYPAIKADLENSLSDGIDTTNASSAVDAFKEIISNVAEAWGRWNQVGEDQCLNIRKLYNEEQAIILKYKVIEDESDTGDLKIQVLADPKNCLALIPRIDIRGYDTLEETAGTATGYRTFKYASAGETLPYGNRNEDIFRTVHAGGLNILDIQNAWGGVRLVRNEELLHDMQGKWMETNPHFLYQTPVVMFYAKQTPLLCNNEVIDLYEVAKGMCGECVDLPLRKYIELLFESLCDCMELHSSLCVKAEVNYSYFIPDTHYQVTVPLILTFPVRMAAQEKGGDFSRSLAEKLERKLEESGLPDGQLHIDLSVYSLLDEDVSVLKQSFILACAKEDTV